jgi:hypothetical protein
MPEVRIHKCQGKSTMTFELENLVNETVKLFGRSSIFRDRDRSSSIF